MESNGLCIEYGYTSLNHVGEELCGDNVEMCVSGQWTTLVLADGLGSGVKANILSTLTSKILCTMVAGGADMEDCVQTIIQTLPVCRERQVAYSTFSVIHVDTCGEGHLFEFDNPEAIWYHRGRTQDFPRVEMDICGKKVFHTDLHLESGDMVFVMSDGTIHAGIGQILNFGWQRKDIMQHLDDNITPHLSARAAACLLASACNDLYLDRPGDDTTVAAVRIRPRMEVHIMVGPPVDREKDALYVQQFMEGANKRIVCGGTTSQVVARCLGRELKTSFDFPDREVPPIGFISGIDLVTEGVITLRRLLALSEKYVSVKDLTPKTYTKRDGGSLLADIIFEESTHVVFFVGQNVNAAHQGLDIDITMKLKLVEHLAANLRRMGKQVTVNYD
ncbi:MAG: SpoIIE family protein phosphatase [Bacteroidales bacterium]|nr:SpoIIE family protein phosphatase [Bacteroidales bacterium]